MMILLSAGLLAPTALLINRLHYIEECLNFSKAVGSLNISRMSMRGAGSGPAAGTISPDSGV
jgi:hypothetical protein